MTDLPDPAAALRSALPGETALGALFSYWQGLWEGDLPPRRAEIDPRRIDAALPYAFILERIAPGLARFRVAGTHLADLMGMDVRGMPVSCLIEPPARDDFAAALARLFEEPAVLDLRLAGPRGPGRARPEGRMLLLPLRSDLNDVSRALGCLMSEPAAPARRPHRFGIAGIAAAPLCAGAPRQQLALHAERPRLRLVARDGVRLPG